MAGSRSFFPSTAISKRQDATSHSTPESEVVAAELAMRKEGLPGLDAWETILGRKVKLRFHEDNQAACRIIDIGHSSALRHCTRTHRIDLGLLHESFEDEHCSLCYCPTDKQSADILTKGFTDAEKWNHAMIGISTMDRNEFWGENIPPSKENDFTTPRSSLPGSQ
jgi:hypothetical protein